MRHTSNEEFRNMPIEKIISLLRNPNEYTDGMSEDEMRAHLKKL